MDWRRSCSLSVMQIEDPSEGQLLIPIAWFYAPKDAKVFRGVSAFTGGVWDRDKPALPPQLGEQPPYESPYFSGENLWGYTGQCRVGSDAQFARGLSAADVAATPPAVPACCASPATGQFWFLRQALTPVQSVVPGVVVGSNWANIGDDINAGVLSSSPGTAPVASTWSSSHTGAAVPATAFLQYLSAPLPAQTILSQPWLLSIGQIIAVTGAPEIRFSFTLSVIDGTDGSQKAELVTAEAIGGQPVPTNGPHFPAKMRQFLEADIAFGDYLCLEIGWTVVNAGGHATPYSLDVVDSGTVPQSPATDATSSPMALLSWPPNGGDVDVPLSGTLACFAFPSVPFGYLPCDGSSQLAAVFPTLFAAIGTTYGSAGPGLFNVPDLRDRVPIGTSPGGLTGNRPTARVLAQTGGEEAHQLVTAELSGHTHPLTDPGHYHYALPGADGFLNQGAGGEWTSATGFRQVIYNYTTGTSFTGVICNSAGGDQAHNNMQPFLVGNWCIKI